MRNKVKWVALFVLSVALVAANASAQGQGQGKGQGKGQRGGGFGGGFGGGGNMLTLLNNPAVQTELKMTDDQKSKAQEYVQEQMQALGGGFGGGGGKGAGGGKGGGKGAGGFDPAAQAERTKTMNAAAEKFAKDNLKPDQAKRLKGIYLQSAALQVLATDEAVQKDLNLTADQKSKITALNEKLATDRTELMGQLRGGGGDFQQIGEKMTALNKEYTDKAVAELNVTQKTKWTEMTGAPFTVPAFGGRRGGGGDDN